MISPDGKRLELRGTDSQPATLTFRSDGKGIRSEYSGKRIDYSPADGVIRVYSAGAGTISDTKPK